MHIQHLRCNNGVPNTWSLTEKRKQTIIMETIVRDDRTIDGMDDLIKVLLIPGRTRFVTQSELAGDDMGKITIQFFMENENQLIFE